MGSTDTTPGLRDKQAKSNKWTITQDGSDSLGQIVMVRLHGKPYTRAFSMSEARHLLRQYQN